MESPLSSSSPERPQPVKRTYAGRAKSRRSSSIANTEEHSDIEDPRAQTMEENPDAVAAISPHRKGGSMKPPSTAGPRKVGLNLPGPSPKRTQRDSEELKKTPSAKTLRSGHSRTSSLQSVDSPRLNRTKPASTLGHKALKSEKSERPETPETEIEPDDNSSVAGSSGGVKKMRRSEAERIQILKDDPTCGTIEPHRIFCSRCNQWVGLEKNRSYSTRYWDRHRKRCDQQRPASTAPSEQNGKSAKKEADEEDATSVTESITSPEKSGRKTEAERLVVLQADSQIEEIRPHEVLCKHCHRWIRLSLKLNYLLGNWNSHKKRCSSLIPTSRLATAERRIVLVNDPRAKNFTAHSVECSACGELVTLTGEGSFNLTNWDHHKVQCPNATTGSSSFSKPISTQQKPVSTIQTPLKRPPPSIASTDGTVIVDNSPSTRVGKKRAREDDDDEEGEESETRPHNRPRTETYEPPTQEAPGPLGWFLAPFKTFIRGFREGIKSSAESG